MKVTRRSAIAFGAGVAVAGLAVAGVANAAIPSAVGGVYTACVNKSSGAVRIVDPAARQRCTSAERLVTWSRHTARGSWGAKVVYLPGDLVQRGGSTWQAKIASKGKAPAAGKYWTLFAAAGATGAQGPAGAQGAVGPQGVPGAKGDRGPSDVYADTGFTVVTTSKTTALSKALPPGTYAVTATLRVNAVASAAGAQTVECDLDLAGVEQSNNATTLPDVGADRSASIAISDVFTVNATSTVTVGCRRGNNTGVVGIDSSSRLMAIQVATVH